MDTKSMLFLGFAVVVVGSVLVYSRYTKPAVDEQLAREDVERKSRGVSALSFGSVLGAVVLGNILTGILFAILYQMCK